MKKFTFEIENANGDGVMNFVVGVENSDLKVLDLQGCNIADIDSYDYYRDNENDLIRVQSDEVIGV